jgi:hypothetical protein
MSTVKPIKENKLLCYCTGTFCGSIRSQQISLSEKKGPSHGIEMCHILYVQVRAKLGDTPLIVLS